MLSVPEVVQVEARPAAAIHLHIPAKDMGKYMDPAINEVLQVIEAQGLRPAGPLFSFHLQRPGEEFNFEIGFPVEGPIKEEGRVRMIERPAARVVRAIHTGPYDGLQRSWQEFQEWVKNERLPVIEMFWESYLTDPGKEPDPKKWRTELNWVIERK